MFDNNDLDPMIFDKSATSNIADWEKIWARMRKLLKRERIRTYSTPTKYAGGALKRCAIDFETYSQVGHHVESKARVLASAVQPGVRGYPYLSMFFFELDRMHYEIIESIKNRKPRHAMDLSKEAWDKWLCGALPQTANTWEAVLERITLENKRLVEACKMAKEFKR